MKVLFLIRKYKIIDGASNALYFYVKNNPLISNSTIVTRHTIDCQPDIHTVEVESFNDLNKLIVNGNYDIIHYFKIEGTELLEWAYKSIKKNSLNLPIVTTVCQRPSFPGLLLSPSEIKKSSKIIFIDRSAYNDPLFSFIPTPQKQTIYFGCSESIIDQTKNLLSTRENSEYIVFGRGSTLSKCPSNILDIYHRINIPNKKFIIAGVPIDSWLGNLAADDKSIKIIPPTNFNDWLNTCNSFDIFLYHIPKTSHSSIDGTLGNAMLLEKSVVYYGSDAPKERIEHGINGFIADTEDDIIKYCELLASDNELRKTIGQQARISTIRDFSLQTTVRKYNQLYETMTSNNSKVANINIPLNYRLYYFRKSWKKILKSYFAGTFIERIHYKNNPWK